MCSLSGDVMIQENVAKKAQLNKCKKCLTATPSVVLRKTDAYCKSCFLPATVHKFRATLGKYRIIRPNERVLILYETGHPSTALLHFIKSGLALETHKKLRLEPVILYIDEHSISAERVNIYERISSEVNSYNFPGYITSLENYMNNMNDEPSYIEMKSGKMEDLIQILEGATGKINASRTLFDDATNICRRQLLIKMAKQLNCGIIFTPDISTDVAINMLSNLSLGRGSHLSLDVGILDDRDPNIKILQPLRYFDMKELAFYNVFNNLEPVSGKKVENSAQSVNKLISKFVCDLQENYPSTIKTVVRTGDKLTCIKSDNICSLCKAPIEIQQELSSSEARNFSHWISTNANTISTNNIDYNTVISNKNENNLCYGCKNLSDVLKI